MCSLIKTLSDIFQEALLATYKELSPTLCIEIVQSTNEKFGHYQCNSAMKLSKILKQNPHQIAKNIVEQINLICNPPIIAKMEIAGPGFINITIDSAYLSKMVQEMLRDSHLSISLPVKKQKIIIDFSSPNIAKEMHVGHLRSTIIGDCLSRLFEFLGHDVIRLNHLGDWGTAFGMLIAYMKKHVPDVLTGKEYTDLTHLVSWYKASKQLFDADPNFKKESQAEVVALQGGNPISLNAWEILCKISKEAYREIYDILDVKIYDRGESFYNPLLQDIVIDLESKGLIEISNGAKCLFLEGFQNREGQSLPLMVQKSDGGYNYDTTDLAAIRHRVEEEKGDRLIYVTDAGQTTHFQMLFKAAEKAGYYDPNKVQVDHVPFGLVLGSDGKKFRTRSGETERLIDLLNTAIDCARKILDQRSPEMDLTEREILAKSLGIGAIKYADLSCNRIGDYMFSYDKMLKFEGNTATYLIYSYVRVAGIKRKVNISLADIKEQIILEHPSEVTLGLHLCQFSEALDQVTQDLLPNRLTDYLYALAEKFNAFFRDCRVEGSPQQNSRLLLCEAVARVMKQGLDILGVKTVEKM